LFFYIGPRHHEKNFQIYDKVQLKLRTPYDISKTYTSIETQQFHYMTFNHIFLLIIICKIKESIMHYSWNAFALDTSKPTISAKNGAKIKPSDDFTEV